MKKIAAVFVMLICVTSVLVSAHPQKKARRPGAVYGLSLVQARKILLRHINDLRVDNTLFTCRACYDFDDKEENDKFPLVTTYSEPLVPFLIREGYVRPSKNGDQVFTAKAKKSKYFEAAAGPDGRLGGAGFRFANFRNPKLMTDRISDPEHVPIEYDLVPTDLTIKFFGKVRRIQSNASFTFEGGVWDVCIGCGR